MDVFIDTCIAKKFKIVIGFSDTVREIKEKIQKEQGYQISAQYLYFNGRELADEDGDTHTYGIHQGCRLFLILQYNSHVEVFVRIPTSGNNRRVRMIVGMTILVKELKELIPFVDLPMSRFVLFFRGVEMVDDRELVEYGITNGSVLEVVVRPSPSPPLQPSPQPPLHPSPQPPLHPSPQPPLHPSPQPPLQPSPQPPLQPPPQSPLQSPPQSPLQSPPQSPLQPPPQPPSWSLLPSLQPPDTSAKYDDPFAICERIEATYMRIVGRTSI